MLTQTLIFQKIKKGKSVRKNLCLPNILLLKLFFRFFLPNNFSDKENVYPTFVLQPFSWKNKCLKKMSYIFFVGGYFFGMTKRLERPCQVGLTGAGSIHAWAITKASESYLEAKQVDYIQAICSLGAPCMHGSKGLNPQIGQHCCFISIKRTCCLWHGKCYKVANSAWYS